MSDLALLTTVTLILSVQHASTILQICLTRGEKKNTLVKHLLFIVELTLGTLENSFSKDYVFTPPQNRGGVIFFTAVCLCVCVCVCGYSCEQNSSRTYEPIWKRILLNGCLAH